MSEDIKNLSNVLNRLKQTDKILLANLYGSYASGKEHTRSDIDLAIYLNARDEKEREDIIDEILMFSDRPIEILMLDSEDESPFIVQESLKGIPLVEPDMEALYKVAPHALHEAESIRYKRAIVSD